MSKDHLIEMDGIVQEVYPGTKYKVELIGDNGKTTGHEITATLSGKLRMNFIRIVKGDRVMVQMSPYDLTTGRITWRVR